VASVRERAEKSRQQLVAKISVPPAIPPEEPQPEPQPTPVAGTENTPEKVQLESAEPQEAEPTEPAEKVEETVEPENGWLTGRRTTYVRIA
jgi:hypothetical protein